MHLLRGSRLLDGSLKESINSSKINTKYNKNIICLLNEVKQLMDLAFKTDTLIDGSLDGSPDSPQASPQAAPQAAPKVTPQTAP